MTKQEVQKLDHGLYRIYWKPEHGGGNSLASVGSLHDGSRWMAPTNWTSSNESKKVIGSGDSWDAVQSVRRIK